MLPINSTKNFSHEISEFMLPLTDEHFSVYNYLMFSSVRLNKIYPSVISEIHYFSSFQKIGSMCFISFIDPLTVPTMTLPPQWCIPSKHCDIMIQKQKYLNSLNESSLSVLTYLGLTFLLNYFCPLHREGCSHSSRRWKQTALFYPCICHNMMPSVLDNGHISA